MPLKNEKLDESTIKRIKNIIKTYAVTVDRATKDEREANDIVQRSIVNPNAAFSSAISLNTVSEDSARTKKEAKEYLDKSLKDQFTPDIPKLEVEMYYDYWLAQYYCGIEDYQRSLNYLVVALNNLSTSELATLDKVFPWDKINFNLMLAHASITKDGLENILKLVTKFAFDSVLFESCNLAKTINYKTLAEISNLSLILLDDKDKTLANTSFTKLLSRYVEQLDKQNFTSESVLDIANILANSCMLNQANSDKVKTNITSVITILNQSTIDFLRNDIANLFAIKTYAILRSYANQENVSVDEFKKTAAEIYSDSFYTPERLTQIIQENKITDSSQVIIIAKQLFDKNPTVEIKKTFVRSCIENGMSLSDLGQVNINMKAMVVDFFKETSWVDELKLDIHQLSHIFKDFNSMELNQILQYYGRSNKRLEEAEHKLLLYQVDLIQTINSILEATNKKRDMTLPSDLVDEIVKYIDDYINFHTDHPHDLKLSQNVLTTFLNEHDLSDLSQVIQNIVESYVDVKEDNPHYEPKTSEFEFLANNLIRAIHELTPKKGKTLAGVTNIDDVVSNYKTAGSLLYMAFTGSKTSPLHEYDELKVKKISSTHHKSTEKLLTAVLMNADKYTRLVTIKELIDIVNETENGRVIGEAAKLLYASVGDRDKLLSLFEAILKINNVNEFFDDAGPEVTHYILSEYVAGKVGNEATPSQVEQLSGWTLRAYIDYIVNNREPKHKKSEELFSNLGMEERVKYFKSAGKKSRDEIIAKIIAINPKDFTEYQNLLYGNVILNILEDPMIALIHLDPVQVQALNNKIKELKATHTWLDKREKTALGFFGLIDVADWFNTILKRNQLEHEPKRLTNISDQVALGMYLNIEASDDPRKPEYERELALKIMRDIKAEQKSSYVNLSYDDVYGPQFAKMIFNNIDFKTDAELLSEKLRLMLVKGFSRSTSLNQKEIDYLINTNNTKDLIEIINGFLTKSSSDIKEAHNLQNEGETKIIQSAKLEDSTKDIPNEEAARLKGEGQRAINKAKDHVEKSVQCKNTAKKMFVSILINIDHLAVLNKDYDLMQSAAHQWNLEDCNYLLSRMNSKELAYNTFLAYLLSKDKFDVSIENEKNSLVLANKTTSLEVDLNKFDLTLVSAPYIKKINPKIIVELFKNKTFINKLNNLTVEQFESLLSTLRSDNIKTIYEYWKNSKEAKYLQTLSLLFLSSDSMVKQLIADKTIHDYHASLDIQTLSAKKIETITKNARVSFLGDLPILSTLTALDDECISTLMKGIDKSDIANIVSLWPLVPELYSSLPKNIFLAILRKKELVAELIAKNKLDYLLTNENLSNLTANELESINKHARAALFVTPSLLQPWVNSPDHAKLLALVSGFKNEGTYFFKSNQVNFQNIFKAWHQGQGYTSIEKSLELGELSKSAQEKLRQEEFALKLLSIEKPKTVLNYLADNARTTTYRSRMATYLFLEMQNENSVLWQNNSDNPNIDTVISLAMHAEKFEEQVLLKLFEHDSVINYVIKEFDSIIKPITSNNLDFFRAIFNSPILERLSSEQINKYIYCATFRGFPPEDFHKAAVKSKILRSYIPTYFDDLVEYGWKSNQSAIRELSKLYIQSPLLINNFDDTFKFIDKYKNKPLIYDAIVDSVFYDQSLFQSLCTNLNTQSPDPRALQFMQDKINNMSKDEFARQVYHDKYTNEAFEQIVITKNKIELPKALQPIIKPLRDRAFWKERSWFVRGLATLSRRLFRMPKSIDYNFEMQTYRESSQVYDTRSPLHIVGSKAGIAKTFSTANPKHVVSDGQSLKAVDKLPESVSKPSISVEGRSVEERKDYEQEANHEHTKKEVNIKKPMN